MRNLLILFSILSSLSVNGAIEGVQEADWEENSERAEQWFVDDENSQTSTSNEESDLKNSLKASDSEVTSMGGENEGEEKTD